MLRASNDLELSRLTKVVVLFPFARLIGLCLLLALVMFSGSLERLPTAAFVLGGAGGIPQGSWKKCMSRRHNPRMSTVRKEELTFGHRQCVKPDQVKEKRQALR